MRPIGQGAVSTIKKQTPARPPKSPTCFDVGKLSNFGNEVPRSLHMIQFCLNNPNGSAKELHAEYQKTVDVLPEYLQAGPLNP